MPDDEELTAKIDALGAKIDGLESRLATQTMTPGQRAAEARRLMRDGYEQSAREREEAAEDGGEE
jgi:hypothetical protein